ncbi:MAG TPA: YlxR family protein [Candidatus Limnocylindrales bacterium]|nr:YlxR family protein [Candidatus Limnocylindrales bacterium]
MRPLRRPPVRSCVACHTSREQRELLRVVRTPGGEVRFDAGGRANGRGAYVCRDEACITKATRRGSLARALATTIPTDLAAELGRQLPMTPGPSGPDMPTAGGSLGQE